VRFVASLRNHIDALVHPSARSDALTAARHRAFIAPRLLGGFAALAALPLYLVVRGVPDWLEFIVFAWLIAPILLGYFLSRTGRYESAHVLSSLALTGLVMVVAWRTGGITSFAAIWLVVVPLEAALSASRRVVAMASSVALGAAGLLLLLTGFGLLPPADHNVGGTLAAFGIVSAALYATGIALGAESLARMSFWLLYAEEDRYRLLARNMTDVIARHARDGSVQFISPAAEPLIGAAARKLLGQGLFQRVHVADRPAYLTAIAKAAQSRIEQSLEFRIRRDAPDADGPPIYVWVEMRCRPVDSQAGADTGINEREVVSVLRDIGPRKAQEQAFEATRIALERANAGKSRFLATMSHELRTPLNAIIGFSDMLMKADELQLAAAQRDDYARLINESGLHLLAVVNGVLDMSKMESGNFEIAPESFAPGPVIANCCDILSLKAREAGVELKARVATALPDIVADKRAINQVLINLISNAIKFSNRDGCVVVSALQERRHIVITVEDGGIGISNEDLPRLGEVFFQAKSTYDRRHAGSGLGLSIVKGLVELHGGDIAIRSRLGEGTCVTVRLPLDCEAHRNGVTPIPISQARVARADQPSLGHAVEDAVPDATTVQVRKRA
jgi:cell cycle sensor histidine kinase DivJ